MNITRFSVTALINIKHLSIIATLSTLTFGCYKGEMESAKIKLDAAKIENSQLKSKSQNLMLEINKLQDLNEKSNLSATTSPGSTEQLQGTQENFQPKIMELLEQWRLSWERGELSKYIACYSTDFIAKNTGMNLSQWKTHKTKVFSSYNSMTVRISNIKIEKLTGSEFYKVSLNQDFEGKGKKNMQDRGLKILEISNNGATWQIRREEFVPN